MHPLKRSEVPLIPTRRAHIIRVAIVSAVVVAAVIAALAHFSALDSFTQADRCVAHTTASGMLAASAPAYCRGAGV